jgi:hypothetical protein
MGTVILPFLEAFALAIAASAVPISIGMTYLFW